MSSLARTISAVPSAVARCGDAPRLSLDELLAPSRVGSRVSNLINCLRENVRIGGQISTKKNPRPKPGVPL
jgi:hypothetical protein